MKKEQFTHNLAKAKRQAEIKRQQDAINKYHREFDEFLIKLKLDHLTK